ncbi:uncharacterized protein LOC104636824 isoform X2 [Balearica regulorum gibbericeps]|uniref:uncharacterized protein LOC104636824 isoform X2 n=1 Tax=Balearica regulorum gibbericeps TaxID=100784 RepID=UPI003F622457
MRLVERNIQKCNQIFWSGMRSDLLTSNRRILPGTQRVSTVQSSNGSRSPTALLQRQQLQQSLSATRRPSEASSGEGGAAGGSSPTEEPAFAFPVSEEQRRELREAFELFHPDGCGVVDVRALKITVRALGCELGKEEMKRIVSQFEPCVEKEILQAFKVFDCDGTGKISFENLKVVASEVGEDITDEELQEMIDEADVNGDGEVDKQEFLRMLTLTDP